MTADLVPADNIAAIEQLDPAAREIAVTRMLSEARSWLAHAMEATSPAEIASFKAQMATIAEATRQLDLSKEIQLDAHEMVRRGERGLGLAIRNGQERGEIRTRDDARLQGYASATGVHVVNDGSRSKDFFSGGQTMHDTYAMTDGVSDEQFDEVLAEAKDEGNLSRANVVRKLKGEPKPKTDRHELLRRTRRIDSNRVIAATVLQVADPCPESVFEHVDYAVLDRDEIPDWVSSLSASISALRSLKSKLEKELSRG